MHHGRWSTTRGHFGQGERDSGSVTQERVDDGVRDARPGDVVIPDAVVHQLVVPATVAGAHVDGASVIKCW